MTSESDKLRKIKTDLKKIFENEYAYDFSRPKMGPLERMMEPGKWASKLQELQWKMSDLAKDKTVDHLVLYAEKNRNVNFGNTGLQLSSNNDRDHFEFEGTDGPSIKFKGHIGPLNSIWLDVDNGKDTSELPKGYNWIARPSVIRIAPDVLTVWNPAGDSVIQETVSSATKLVSILENIAKTALSTEKVDPENPPFLRPRSFATESIFKKLKEANGRVIAKRPMTNEEIARYSSEIYSYDEDITDVASECGFKVTKKVEHKVHTVRYGFIRGTKEEELVDVNWDLIKTENNKTYEMCIYLTLTRDAKGVIKSDTYTPDWEFTISDAASGNIRNSQSGPTRSNGNGKYRDSRDVTWADQLRKYP